MIEQIFGKKEFTDLEQQIVAYVDVNPRKVITLSLEELSAECFVSQASIIRLCKKLGLKGFSDFKIRIAQEIETFTEQAGEIHVDLPIRKENSFKDIGEMMYELSYRALKRSFQSLDYNMLKRAANLLNRADLIHIYGRGESLIIAEDFHYKLLRIGKNSCLETLNGFPEAKSYYADGKVSRAAVVISYYCNSRQLHYVIDELTGSKIPFILLTAAEKPFPYDTMAYAVLQVHSSESRFKMGSFSSRTSMLYVLDCLYGILFSLDYDKNMDNLVKFARRKVERSYFYSGLGRGDSTD